MEIDRRTFLRAAAALPFSSRPLELLFQNTEVRMNTSVLFYHEVSEVAMTNDILRLINSGAEPISLENLNLSLKGEIEIPAPRTFMVTCDDRWLSQYTAGLKAVDRVQTLTDIFVPVTFFVMTRFNGQPITEDMPESIPSFNDGNPNHLYMDKGQLIDLIKKGHNVENHTSNHVNIGRLNSEQLSREVELAEQKLDDLWSLAGVERRVRGFAYPYGGYSGKAEYIESVGIDIAFSTENVNLLSSNRRFMLGRVRKS